MLAPLAQPTALLDKLRRLQQLGVALATETDLQVLLDAVVREAAEMAEAQRATLALIIPGEQGLEVRAEWGNPDGPRPRCYLDRRGAIGEALLSGHPAISDVAADDETLAAAAGAWQVSVPLVFQNLILGSLNVRGAAGNVAQAEQNVELLTTLAGFAATAIYTERLRREQQDHSAAVYDLQRHSQAMMSRASEEDVLEEGARVLARLLETERVAIFLHDPDTVGLRVSGASANSSPTLAALADALHPGSLASGYSNGLLFLPNVAEAALLPPAVRAAAEAEQIRAVLSFAVGNEQMAGLGLVLAVFRERPTLLSHQLELALLYANQVSVAIHTMRLSMQAAQTAREQAALFAITAALHSGGEAEIIGQRVLDTLALALHASGGCLIMGDLVDNGNGDRALNGLQLVQTGSPHGQIEYYVALVASGLTDTLGPMVDGDGWQAIFARLETRFGLAGMLSLWRVSGPVRFTPRERELIQTVSNELARHLENRALIARELEAISDVGLPAPTAQVSEMAARITERARSLAHSHGAAMLVYDEDSEAFRLEAESGDLPDLRWLEGTINHAFLHSLRDSQMLYPRDVARLGGTPTGAEQDRGEHILLVPLAHDDLQVGVLLFAYSDAVKYRSRLPFIQAMGQRAAMVLRNLKLQIDADQLAMLEERNRIARTMHDGLAQQLAQIRFRTELVRRLVKLDPDRAMSELELVQHELKKGIGGIRRTINSLEPVMIKKLGLKLALLKLGEDLSEDANDPLRMTVEIGTPVRSLQAQLTVFRLVQEALSYVMNLHEEGECSCDVRVGGDEVEVTVSHSGEPRVPGVPDLIREQLLAAVRNRNGEVEVESRAGRLIVTAGMRLRGDGA